MKSEEPVDVIVHHRFRQPAERVFDAWLDARMARQFLFSTDTGEMVRCDIDPRVGGHDDKDDTTSGAIYRIAPKGFKPVVPDFDLATAEGQVTAPRSPAVNVRSLGAKALAARGAAAVPAVEALL